MSSARSVQNPPSLLISQGSGNPFSFAQTSETITGTVDPDPIGFQSFEVPGGYSGGVYVPSSGVPELKDCVVLAPLLHNTITIFNPYSGETLDEIDISDAWLEAGDFYLYAASNPSSIVPYEYSEKEDEAKGQPPAEASAYLLQTLKRFSGATHIPNTPLIVFSPATWFFEGTYDLWRSNNAPWEYKLMFGVLDLSTRSFKFVPVDLEQLKLAMPPEQYRRRILVYSDLRRSATAPVINGSTLSVWGSSSGEVYIPGASVRWIFPGVRDPFSLDGNPRAPGWYYKNGSNHEIIQGGGSALLAQNDFWAAQMSIATKLIYDGSTWTTKAYMQYATETVSNVLLSQVNWSCAGGFQDGDKSYIYPQYLKRRGFIPFEPNSSTVGASRGALGSTQGGPTLGTRTIFGAGELVFDDQTKMALVVYKSGLASLQSAKNLVGVPGIAAGVVSYKTSKGIESTAFTEILNMSVTEMDKYQTGIVYNLPTLPVLVTRNTEDLVKQSQEMYELDIAPNVSTTTISFSPEATSRWKFEVGHPVSSGCAINTDAIATNSPTFAPSALGFFDMGNNTSKTGDILPYSPPRFEGAGFFLQLEENIRKWMKLVQEDSLSEIKEFLKLPRGFFMYRCQGNPIPLKERGFVYTPSMNGQLACVYDPNARPRNVIIGSDLEVQRARLFERPKFIVDENTSRKTLSATRIYNPVSVSRPSSMQKCGQVFRLEQRRFPTVTDKSMIPCFFRGQVSNKLREFTTPDYGAITPISLGVDQGRSGRDLVPYNPRRQQSVVHQRIITNSNATTRFFPNDSKAGMFVIKKQTTDLFTEALVDAAAQSTFDLPTGL